MSSEYPSSLILCLLPHLSDVPVTITAQQGTPKCSSFKQPRCYNRGCCRPRIGGHRRRAASALELGGREPASKGAYALASGPRTQRKRGGGMQTVKPAARVRDAGLAPPQSTFLPAPPHFRQSPLLPGSPASFSYAPPCP